MTDGLTKAVPGHVLEKTILRAIGLLALLYLFILSITLLGASFKLFGQDFADAIFQTTANPVVGLMIGLLGTAVIQSSSTTTSLVVGLVGSGVLPLAAAIPIIMGANIGTSITNMIVSLAHISRSEEYRRAFSGSVVHDIFNICAVIVLLPLQIWFDLIGKSAHMLESVFEGFGGLEFSSPLAGITKPVARWLLHETGDSGVIGAVISILLLFIALRYIVKLLKSLVLQRVEHFFRRYIFRNPLLGFMVGLVLTTMVQSSSITTSLVVPLMGAGIVSLNQVFPYMLGANVGTTVTAFLASFVIGTPEAVSVAFAHLLFNIYGIGIFWPLKKIPIAAAEYLSGLTQKSRLVPIAYIAIVFFLIPGIVIYTMRQ
jgi:sodium-dependent phosphate cotransporter